MSDRDARLQELLGDELVQLIDRRAAIERELLALNANIYAALVNRVQSQSGVAMLRPYEALEKQVRAHDRRLNRKKTSIADLRMVVEEQEQRLKVLEERLGDDASVGREQRDQS